MLKAILKAFMSIMLFMLTVFSVNTFGFGVWSLSFMAVAVLIFLSLGIRAMDEFAILLARVAGILCGLGALLIGVMGTVGGSYHLDQNSQVMMLGMLVSFVLGLSFFAVSDERNREP